MPTLNSASAPQLGSVVGSPPPTKKLRSAKRLRGALLALTLVGAALGHVHYANATVDDVFISFRYAENLVHGHGLVFNPGERVEGYSNLLWTLLMALPIALGFDRFEFGVLAFAKGLGLLLNLGTLVLLWRTAELGRPRSAAPFVATVYLAAALPFLVWGVIGLETPLVAFLILAALHLHIAEELAEADGRRALPWSYVVLVLAALTRPEPVVLLFPMAAMRLARRLWRGASWRVLVRESCWLLLFVVPYAAFLGWRFGYYGELLPNTYYAKMDHDPRVAARGLRYLESASRNLAWGWLLAVVTLAASQARAVSHRVLATSLFLVTLLLVIWREGGDWMPGYRMLVPALPLVALLVHEAWVASGGLALQRLAPPASVPAWVMSEQWVSAWRRAVAKVAHRPRLDVGIRLVVRSLLVVVLAVSVARGHAAVSMQVPSGFRGISWGARGYLDAARWMKRELPADSLVALGEAGLVPYYTKLPTLDLFGLTDKHIARQEGALHTKFDADYVFAKSPDYFFLVAKRSPQGHWSSDQHHAVMLFRDPRFFANYVLSRDFGTGVLFARRDARARGTERR